MRTKPGGFSLRLSEEERKQLDSLASGLGIARADAFRELLKRATVVTLPTVVLRETEEAEAVAQ